MFNANTFGFINGVVELLGLSVGLYVAKASRVVFISAILAVIIADPLLDAYAIFTAEKEKYSLEVASKTAMQAFLSNFIVKFSILMMYVIIPNLKIAIYTVCTLGFISVFLFGLWKNMPLKENLINLAIIVVLIFITWSAEHLVQRIFKK
jgi:hypothetical protein